LIAVITIVVIALVAGLVWWLNQPSDPAASDYRDIGSGVSVSTDASDKIQAAVDDKVATFAIPQTQPAGSVVHVTPDGKLDKPVTLRFKLNRKANDPQDVILAVNQTGRDDGWTLVAPTKVDGDYAYYATTHLSWWEPLWRDFNNLVKSIVDELKSDLNGLTGDAFAEADKPHCDNEQQAKDKGYSINWSGAEVLYYCLGLTGDGKPVATVVNKKRYPVFVNHAGISAPNNPKSKLGLEMFGRHAFSGDQTVMMPFDALTLHYNLAQGQSQSFTTKYDGFAQGLNQLEFGVTVAANILTRFGAGEGTISNGAINADQFDRIANWTSKALQIKDCANAINTDKPNVGEILSGCFDPSAIADVFGWKGVILAAAMVAGPVVNFFRSQFDTLGDLLHGKDQEKITVSYNPPVVPKALYVGEWHVHHADMVINADGTGTYEWVTGPCASPSGATQLCKGHAVLSFKVTNASYMVGTYVKVWYTASDGGPTPPGFNDVDQDRLAGENFTITKNSDHMLATEDGTGAKPGNPIMCDDYASQRNDTPEFQDCGA